MSLTCLLAIMKYVSRPKSAAGKDIDIVIADILGQKYRYHIDIGKGDMAPPLLTTLPDQGPDFRNFLGRS